VEVEVHLYSILRERLPSESKGIARVTMPEGATVADLLARFEIDQPVVVVVNGSRVRDRLEKLQTGDVVGIFTPVAGG
jgi:sulfur carrier protein ThiS